MIQDYGFRLYNPAIGKFLSVDPLSPEYPELTPYQFASNRPIDGIDLDGLEYYGPGHRPDQDLQAGIQHTDHREVDKNQRAVADALTMPIRAGATGIHALGAGVLKIPQYAQGDFSGGAPSYYDFMNFRWNQGGTYQSEQTMNQMSWEAISEGLGALGGVAISTAAARILRAKHARNFGPRTDFANIYGPNGFGTAEYDKAIDLFTEGASGKGGIMAFGNDASVSKAIVGYMEPIDGVVDLHLHKAHWDFDNFIIKQDGSAIPVSIEAMAQAVNELYPTASHIRLFACHGNEVASKLAKLTDKKVLSNSDLLYVSDKGYYSHRGRVHITDAKGETNILKKEQR